MGDSLILPSYPGCDIAYKRTPLYTTRVQNTPSGREVAVSYESYPRYEWELKFNVLRNFLTTAEAIQLEALFHSLKGRGDYFLFEDPEQNSASNVSIGTGTGGVNQFRLQRVHDFGGILTYEPVQNPYNVEVFLTDTLHTGTKLLQTSRTNRVLHSGDASNGAWSKVNTSVAGNTAAAPDGTNTAAKVLGTDVTNFHYVDTSTYTPADNAVISASVYVKKADYDIFAIALYHKSGGSADLKVNLTNGNLVAWTSYTNNGVTATYRIVALANGWYRLIIENFPVGTGATAPRLRCYLCDNGGNANFLGSSSLGTFLWGGQIEDGAVAGAYIPTTTAAVTQTDYAVSAAGLVTTAVNPRAGATLTWTGKYRYRCRLLDDKLPLSRTHYQIWNSVFKFRSVKV